MRREFLHIAGKNADHNPTTWIVPGWACDAVPGLALHITTDDGRPDYENGWTITHIRGGVALLKYLPTAGDALAALRELAPLCDWRASPAELNQLPNRDAIVRSINRIIEQRVHPVRDDLLHYRFKVGSVSKNALAAARLVGGGVQ